MTKRRNLPNIQNIPIRTELGRQLRAAFVCPPPPPTPLCVMCKKRPAFGALCHVCRKAGQ